LSTFLVFASSVSAELVTIIKLSEWTSCEYLSVVDGAQQGGKFDAGDRTSTTRRREENARGLFWTVNMRSPNIFNGVPSWKALLASHYMNLNLKRWMKNSYKTNEFESKMLETGRKQEIKHYRRKGIPWSWDMKRAHWSECVTNTQSDTIIHGKTQTYTYNKTSLTRKLLRSLWYNKPYSKLCLHQKKIALIGWINY